MTIDERLERLAERHEALTQSVELMIAENRERDAKAAAAVAASEQKFEVIRQTFLTCLDSIQSLERIATAHEARIGRLESE